MHVRYLAAAAATMALTTVLPVAVANGSASGATATQPARLATKAPTTVPAPAAGPGAKVTVSRTDDLVNQTVSVSWSGFKPSSATRLQNSGDSLDVNTENPVRVYQCRGTDPASSSECYGSPGFRGIDATDTTPAVPAVRAFTYQGQTDPFDATPDGPANWQDNVTRADGTGEVSIQLFTKRESASLGCNADVPCSIVVVPNYGRPFGATEDFLDAPWAWANRTVVPLHFLRVEDACPLTASSLRVEGSPFATDLMAMWRAKTCTLAKRAVTLDYTAIGEPQTRSDVASGTTDVGLVVDPLEAEAAQPRGVVYAPISLTGLVVAFQVDDRHGRPVTSMRLNARLVAKIITASYRSGADPAVIDNPVNLFRDPEFLALNPGVDWPSGSPGNRPLLLGDLSDTTVALTRWIASDPDASAFVKGQPDPWGMTVNAHYKKLALPFASYPLLDENLSTTFQPIQGLDALARQLSIAQFPGALVTVENGQNVVTKPPRQNPGAREVIGIVDAASAARFRLPTASLENTGGSFVAPTTQSLQTAAKHSKVNDDGVTRSVDLTSKDKGIYPLTLLVSAALSTQADKQSRDQIVDFLEYAAGPGQVPGDQVGQLPGGHAPLPKALVEQVRTAQQAIAAGPADDPTETPSATPTDFTPGIDPVPLPEPLPTDVPGSGQGPGEPSANPSATSPGSPDKVQEAGPQMMSLATEPKGSRQWVLPVLLVLALIALLAGPLLMAMVQDNRGPRWLRH